MKKKDIKEYFQAIRSLDLAKVKSLVEGNSDYITACNFAPPKKDDGQSGLQVAFKVGAFEIAEYLINKGADLNFIESSDINEWKAPVLHDCIRAVFYQTNTMQKDLKKFSEAFRILKLMLDKGANPNALDSYGNSCLHRAFLDARIFIDHPACTQEMKTVEQARMVFRELIQHGANVNYSDERRETVQYMIVNYRFEKYKLLQFEDLPEFVPEVQQTGFWKRLFK